MLLQSVHHLVQHGMNLDTTASRLRPRLDYPHVAIICQTELLFANQGFQFSERLLNLTLEYLRLDICEPSLQWPVVRRPSQIYHHVWFAEEFVHSICHCIEIAGTKLRVSFDLLEAATGEDVNAPFDDGQAYYGLFKILFDKVDRGLQGQFEKRYDECEFEFFLEVFKLFAVWVTYVETLRENSANIHIMFPNQVLHIVS